MKNIKNIIIKIILFIAVINNNIIALASTPTPNKVSKTDPVQFLHTITDQVLTELKHSRKDSSNTAEKTNKIVNNFILPNVDFEEMCKWIAGRGIWSKATNEDRDEFIKELRTLLTKTYSSTLNDYTEEKIEFQNYNGDINAKRIQVKSVVVRPDKENLLVDYRLVATEDSWKVYDVIIEGVSILQGFRTQFSDDIKINGLKTVTKKIKNHNNQNAKL
jgi:phospholipid transport system substrate-binding protein